MKTRIALIAACAGALALSQIDVAFAQSLLVNTSHSNIRHQGKKISRTKPPRPTAVVNTNSHPGTTAKPNALQDVSTTRGRVLPGSGKGKTGPAAISDQASGGILTKNKE